MMVNTNTLQNFLRTITKKHFILVQKAMSNFTIRLVIIRNLIMKTIQGESNINNDTQKIEYGMVISHEDI